MKYFLLAVFLINISIDLHSTDFKRLDLLETGNKNLENKNTCKAAMYFFAFKEYNNTIEKFISNKKLNDQLDSIIDECVRQSKVNLSRASDLEFFKQNNNIEFGQEIKNVPKVKNLFD